MQNPSEPLVSIQNTANDFLATSTLPPRKRSEYGTLYRAVTLTADQTPSNTDEQERLEALHPGKKLFFDTCKGKLFSAGSPIQTYLGIPTTRAFGYGCLKWSLEFQRHIHEECLGDALPDFFRDGSLPGPSDSLSSSNPSPPLSFSDTRPPKKEYAKDDHPTGEVWTLAVPDSDLSTLSPAFPPHSSPAPSAENAYLTAEPEVTTFYVKPGDFIVLGTKGLFECLSDEEVVGLVGVWVEERRRYPKLRQYIKYPTLSQPEAWHGIPVSAVSVPGDADGSPTDPHLLELKAHVDELAWRSAKLVQTQEKVLEIAVDGRRADFSRLTRLFVGLGRKRIIDVKELPIITEEGCTLPLSVDPEDDDGDANLLELSLKNSRLNVAKKPYPQSPYSWRKQEPNFIFDDVDLCSVSAHLTRNAFNTKGRNLTRGMLTHKWGPMKKYRDDIAIQVIFFE
ncbi:hypothetical protein EST38_g8595 [Candolleomyces aberdarensis]|uniref:PPM-type phosphatase domain-containing protein n=1 Tax=Candolleomyces aberdarensis TaxID=2316362 RepID=A0A4Q2DC25_9AGAR|nr:hypothetical protein EST38_g8595 [Candolleomyces aberdarensis]